MDGPQPVVPQEDSLAPQLSSLCSRGESSYLGLCCNMQHQEPMNPLSFSLHCDGPQAGPQWKPQKGQRISGNLGENVLPGPHTLRLSPRLIQSASASSQIKIWAHLAKYSSPVISCILGPSHLATAR